MHGIATEPIPGFKKDFFIIEIECSDAKYVLALLFFFLHLFGFKGRYQLTGNGRAHAGISEDAVNHSWMGPACHHWQGGGMKCSEHKGDHSRRRQITMEQSLNLGVP